MRSKICSICPRALPLRISSPMATFVISLLPDAVSSANLSTKGTGRLSTQKYPASSRIFSAVAFPAPDMPVTITSLITVPPQSPGISPPSEGGRRKPHTPAPAPAESAPRSQMRWHFPG